MSYLIQLLKVLVQNYKVDKLKILAIKSDTKSFLTCTHAYLQNPAEIKENCNTDVKTQ